MSARKQVVFTTWAVELPAASSTAFTFSSDWRDCASIPSGISPVFGFTGSWPETNTKPLPAVPWE